jgi:hypothetical protein
MDVDFVVLLLLLLLLLLQAVTGLTNMIPTVTEKEALCVGMFLTLLLQDLQVKHHHV